MWFILFFGHLYLMCCDQGIFGLEEPSQPIESLCSLSTAKATTEHVPKCHRLLNPCRDVDSISALDSCAAAGKFQY